MEHSSGMFPLITLYVVEPRNYSPAGRADPHRGSSELDSYTSRPTLEEYSKAVEAILTRITWNHGETTALDKFGDELNRAYFKASEVAKASVKQRLEYHPVDAKEQAVQELEPLQEEKELEAFIKQEAEKQAQAREVRKMPRQKPKQAVKLKDRPLPHTPTPQADNSDDYGLGK